jgi:hypothetical protein
MGFKWHETERQLEYEFKNIESLIGSAIDSSTKSNKAFDEQFAQIRNAVAVECDRIKKSFALCVWELKNSQQRTHYVEYHQHRLIILIDELFGVSKGGKDKPRFNSRISSEAFFIYDQLEDILDLMQNELSEYFSLDAKMPDPHKAKVLKRIQEKQEEIQALMNGKENALMGICCNHIKAFLIGREHKTTYRKVHYMEKLVESIGILLKTEGAELPAEDEFQALLISMDFNSIEYFNYHIGHIQNQLAELDSDAERLENLAFYYKVINQIRSTYDLVYDSGSKGIRTQLSEWISEEVQFLERKRNLTSTSKVAENDFGKKDFKLEFDMSVSQFAFFIKAFIETGVIQNKNISEVIRFLAKFVKTKRSENISYESFRIKYYNVEDNTKNAVKNTLHNSIGYINSN